MDILIKKTKTCSFGDLNSGDVFRVQGGDQYYLKIKESNSGDNTLNLKTCVLSFINNDKTVEPLRAQMVVFK